MRDPAPVPILLKDYAPPAFLIETVDLDIELFEDHASVRSRLAISRNPKAADSNASLVLDAEELELKSVALDGRSLATDEYAVMVDARDPLDVAEAGRAVEWADYVNTWKPAAAAPGRSGG